MAAGDLVVFNEARAFLIDGGFEPTDDLKVALVTTATTPTASTASPTLSDFTQVTAGGNYVAGGISIGNLGALISQTSGTVTADSATNPSWAQNAGNPTNARWAIVYNDTDASDQAIAFIDLGATVDMTAGALTITWNASGLFTIS
jgi:hypothetical protein